MNYLVIPMVGIMRESTAHGLMKFLPFNIIKL